MLPKSKKIFNLIFILLCLTTIAFSSPDEESNEPNPGVVRNIEILLNNDSSADEKIAAAENLARLGDRSAIPHLQVISQSHTNRSVRVAAADAVMVLTD